MMIQIDIKMPDNCLKCPMQFGGWCYVSPPEVDERVAPTVDEAWEQGKPDWCPLVDVPENNVGKMDDLVSRQAAIKTIEWWFGILKQNPDILIDAVKILPSVQPERKKGNWIFNSPVTMKCDQCGFVIKDWDWHRFKFCPNCDCDMRGEQDENR